MTLFSVTLHQHSFNLFISVAFQDKLLCSQEVQLPPFCSWGAETQRPGKSLDQSPSSSASPTAPFCPPESPGAPGTKFLLVRIENLLGLADVRHQGQGAPPLGAWARGALKMGERPEQLLPDSWDGQMGKWA